MAEKQRNTLVEIVQQEGNNECAECGDKKIEWASCTFGVLVCQTCSSVHRTLKSSQNVIKYVHLDKWDEDHLQMLKMIDNKKAKQKYELHVPIYYQKPNSQSAYVLKKEWIIAKYERLEFINLAKQTAYDCATKTGFLWKMGRDRQQFAQRKFVLSRSDNTLCYFVNEDGTKQRQPKSVIDLDFLNAVFVPEKVGNPFGLQLTYIKNGSTRNLFLYSETSKEIVDWFMCIRATKFERRKIAFPDRELTQLAEGLTRDFLLEGWLSKMGPKNEPFKRRWFTLDYRKLMYLEEPLNAYAKGEVFIGHKDAGYRVSIGCEAGNSGKPVDSCSHSYCFTLHTPGRNFVMRAETRDEMEKWMTTLESVIEQPLTTYDTRLAAVLVPKKASSSFRLIKR